MEIGSSVPYSQEPIFKKSVMTIMGAPENNILCVTIIVQ